MTRRLVAILSCVLFVLALLTAGLWIHSYDMRDTFALWTSDRRCLAVQSARGRMRLSLITTESTRGASVPAFVHFSQSLEYSLNSGIDFSRRQWAFETGVTGSIDLKTTALSIWPICLLFLMAPAARIGLYGFRNRKRSALTAARDDSNRPVQDIASWPEHAGEIECPMCGYNLRGLASPRCPECGYSFSWAQLLDPTQRRHPYLFEHAQPHPLRRLFKTLTRNWEPNTFWRTLYPSQTPNTARLLFYGFLCMFIAATPALVVVWAMSWKNPFNRFPTWDANFVQLLRRKDSTIGWLSLVMAFYPLLTAISLLIFQQSMRRAKVKAGHALRCAIYSGDVIVWGVLLQWAAILFESMDTRGWGTSVALARMLALGIVLTLAVTFLRLLEAYKHYMKFPNVLATILLSQFAVILLMTWVVIRATGAALFQ